MSNSIKTDTNARTDNTGFASCYRHHSLTVLHLKETILFLDNFVLRNPPERKAANR